MLNKIKQTTNKKSLSAEASVARRAKQETGHVDERRAARREGGQAGGQVDRLHGDAGTHACVIMTCTIHVCELAAQIRPIHEVRIWKSGSSA